MQLQSTAAHTKRKRGKAAAVNDKKKLPRERLQELRARADLSTHSIARSLGYSSASSYHKYERAAAQKDRPIPLDVVRRLIPLFRGRGQPPITPEEMMELTDLQAGLPKSVVAQYLSPTVDDGKGLLVVRYRIEPGVYVQETSVARQYGAAIIGASGQFDLSKQFVAVCSEKCGKWYDKGAQLHCVDPSEFTPASMLKRHVVVSVPYRDGDLTTIAVAEVVNATAGKIAMIGADGVPVEGKVLGVVIGAYIKE